jgi:hypothetical protein
MEREHVRCLMGLSARVRRHAPDERYEGPDGEVCRLLRDGQRRRDVVTIPGTRT